MCLLQVISLSVIVTSSFFSGEEQENKIATKTERQKETQRKLLVKLIVFVSLWQKFNTNNYNKAQSLNKLLPLLRLHITK